MGIFKRLAKWVERAGKPVGKLPSAETRITNVRNRYRYRLLQEDPDEYFRRDPMPRFDFQGVRQSFEPIIYYWSSNSGGTRRAAEKLTTPTQPISEVDEVERPFIVMCPSFDQPKGGFTPKPVEKFLESHGQWLVGVLGAGNLNFGEYFCQSAKDISAQYKVPVLHRIDIMGNEHDYETIDRGVKQHWGTLLNMKGLA